MAFIDKNLLPEEKIEYRARTHWWIFARPFFLLIVSIIGFSIGNVAGVTVGVLAILFLMATSISNFSISFQRNWASQINGFLLKQVLLKEIL